MPAANSSAVEQYGTQQVPLNLADGGGPDLPPTLIPQGQVLVLGDHRGNSRDSRYFGTVEVDELYGKAGAVFWRRSSGPLWKDL